MSAHAVGIDLGGTNLKAALVQRGEGILKRATVETAVGEGTERIIEQIAELVDRMIAASPGSHVEGVGIGTPGPVNWERTTVLNPPNLPGWRNIDMQDALEERVGLGLPVIVENDANAAALGSAYYGAGVPFDSFIMITLGTGVGGAIIYQDEIFRGSTGAAGEIGHMSIDFEGPMDRYGIAGASEAYLGQHFLSRHARYALLTRTDSHVHELAGADLADLTPEMLHDAAEAGDEPAREVLAWAGHKLGCVLSSTINLLDIRNVVVGGGVSQAGAYILDPARAALRRYVMPSLRGHIEVVRETLGNDVGLLGAAHLAFKQRSPTDASSRPHSAA